MFRFYPERSWEIPLGHQPSENLSVLTTLINDYEVRSVCEIGTYMGGSARFFAEHKQIEVVICVDPWVAQPGAQDEFGTEIDWPSLCGVPRNYFGIFVDCMRSLGLWHKIVPLAGCSEDVEHFVPEVDLVYVDGDHSYAGCLWDLKLYGPKARKVICGDDYHHRSPVRPPNYRPGMPAAACRNTEHGDCMCVPCYPGVVRAVNEVFPEHKHGSRFWWLEKT